ncbi:phenylalanine--tRNA ligase subunit beta [Betaproteobacteria bacterium PRO7]|nr:phenylalanine--tRNA ligase subunit beta [Burkholderiaceae bacterium]MDL1862255.1 phenylalanine--tRNA ligase subunit beta [Betaproteobacteria bacterium PRO7]GIL04712.1 MAG: phenylalanine--tRNA ligase beta subunit [Betaproteobacteria bacterium]
MQFSEQWLRAYVNPPIGADELAERLTMAGLEIEENEPVAPPFSGVVVAQVLAVEKHPNADKLTVCRVDAGTGEALNIVCGAPNVAAGMRAPCALEGAVLPGDFRIRRTKMRGVESQGMLCSARELGLSDDHSGLLVLPADAPIGRGVREVLALDDRRFTIKLTPNRGDCLSVLGIAREVAAITGTRLAAPVFAKVAPTSDERLPVKVHHADLCGRFSGRVIRGVNARAATPEWMKRRLERSGQRPISALVDISNYVMLELGRPSHVFDLDKVTGSLQVRWGRAGEKVELLSGQIVEVDNWVGVIADDRGVEALAGVMGGAATAVTLDTRNIYLEAAFWWPESIQGRARRYNFSTDAAHRFERGVDFATTVDHIEYITRLIVEICGTTETRIGPVDDQVLRLPERKPVRMRTERCRRVIGVPIGDDEIAAAFARLGLPAERRGAEFWVTPPSYRFDLEVEEDLIEEVARLWGFERIPAHPPLAPAVMRTQPETLRPVHALRRELADAGYQELVNFSFVDAAWEQDFAGNVEPIRVLNPIASQLAVMRTTLIGGLVAALKYNLNRKAARVRVFELGRVYAKDPALADGPLAVAGVRQPNRIGGLAYGLAWDEQWGVAKREVDYFDVKGDVERLLRRSDARFVAAEHPALHPGRSARVDFDGRAIGWIGELHPRWQQRYELPRAPIVFELDVDPLLPTPLPRFEEVPKFPAVLRDVAMWVDASVTLQRVLDEVARIARTDERLRVLRDFRLFDLYRPGGEDSSKFAGASANALLNKEKSLAFRIVLQDTDRTLADADADAAVAAIVEGLGAQIGARLRQ